MVAGASGGVGRAIVQRLAAEGVPVKALVRDVSRAVCIPQPLNQVQGSAYGLEGTNSIPQR